MGSVSCITTEASSFTTAAGACMISMSRSGEITLIRRRVGVDVTGALAAGTGTFAGGGGGGGELTGAC